MNLLAFLIRASGWSLLPSCIAGAISGVGTVAIIGLIRTSLAGSGSESTALVWRYALICGVVLLSSVASQLLLVRFSQQAIVDLRLQLGRQILTAPLRELENVGSARLTALLSDDVNVLANCFMVLPGLFINLAVILTCFGYMWWLSGRTFFYVLAFMVLGIASYQLPNVYAWKQFGLARRQQDILFAHFRGLTEGVKELKLHASKRDAFLKRSLEATATEYRRRSIAGLNIYSIASSWGQLLFFLLIAFLLFLLPKFTATNYAVVSGYVLVCLFLMAPLGTLLAILPVFGRASVAFKNLEKLGLSLIQEKTKPAPSLQSRNGNWREIKLENVSHTYFRDGEDRPFKIGPINLSFMPGEIVFLTGGNGSGKTTFAKILTSLYLPESGRITLDNEPITDDNRQGYRDHFTAVFSDFYLFETLTGIGLDCDEEKTNRYLDELRLGNKVCVKNGAFSTTTLSQGQRKRLALLVSFLEDRQFYIFDEWAADQDPLFKDIFYTQVLPELKNRGKTVLAITHDDRYFDMADRLIKMDLGQISSDLYLPGSKDRPAPELVASNGLHSFAAAPGSAPLPEKETGPTPLDKESGTKKLKYPWRASMSVLMLISLLIWWARLSLKAPAPAPENALPEAFSAQRAFLHLNQIAQKPHPLGSAEHSRVRDYIQEQLRAMGLTPRIEEQTVADADFSRRFGFLISAGRPQNIVVTLAGTKNTRSILVSAHYDSVPSGPGASDDGAAVAAFLETIRALRAGPQLQNDIIFLFADGEETGLLGARGFIENAERARTVGLALNFDARGASGLDLMFETGAGNGALIRELARVAPYPSASSFGYEIYKHLPNDTDFTEFKRQGITGLNFAFINDYPYYHTARDDIQNVDRGTLQQRGSNLLSLIRDFGNKDLTAIRTRDSVFFNLPGWLLVQYSTSWVKPLTALVIVVLGAALVLGVRRRHMSIRGILFGVVVSLLSVFASLIAVTVSWMAVIFLIHPEYRQIAGGNSYNPGIYAAALSALGLAVITAIYAWALRRTTLLSLAAGAAFVWMCLLILCATVFPGASYIFTWPLLFCGMAFVLQMALKNREPDPETPAGYRQLALMSISTIPTVLVAVPVLYLIFMGLTLLGSGIAAAFMALLFGLLLPQLHVLCARGSKIFPAFALLAFLALMVAGGPAAALTERHPRPDSLMYGFNPDQNAATWISFDRAPDAWTKQFIPPQASERELAEFFPFTARKFRVASAPLAPLASPVVDVLQDETSAGIRTLHLRVHSQRHAPELIISTSSGDQLREAILDGRSLGNLEEMAPVLKSRHVWGFDFAGLPESGIDLVLRIAPRPIQLTFIDASYGFPDSLSATMPSRPAAMIAHPIPITDKTYVTVTKTF